MHTGTDKNIKPKAEQLKQFHTDNKNQKLTTNKGLKITNPDDSLKAGLRGPTLLEDFQFREKITHFDHERIPERVVHARGAGAHGFFQVYESMSEYTKAKFLQNPAVPVPVFVRFSTVAGSRGSADTVRDVRGFATKFYTEDGIFDLVGNNIPIFFIQDAIKFPDFIHAVKPEPNNEIPQASSAHDTFWDFVVSAPETAHMIMWVMSDRAIPRSFRMMEGFGVNTFRFVNAQGTARFVKFHWKPLLGVHSLAWDEAQKLSGKNADFHRQDLWDAIEQGNYPEYEFGVQMIDEAQEFDFDFDILDPTKIWPEEVVPVKIIGKLTLNRNPDNFFAETEQVAFCPANIVPGIDFSNDPLLQGRLFSYEDTQISRLGGPNFHEIPINRPVVPVHNNQRDGMHRMTINPGQVSYFPNTLAGNTPSPAAEEEGGFMHHAEKIDAQVVRGRSDSFRDHYSQARLFWNSMSVPEKLHIKSAFAFEVGHVKDKALRQRVVDTFANVSVELADDLAASLGLKAPARPASPPAQTASSPALSQANTIRNAKTRKAAVLVQSGFCAKSVNTVMDELKQAGIACEIVSGRIGMITGKDGTQCEAAQSFSTVPSVVYDAVYIPGGADSVAELGKCPKVRAFIFEAYQHAKPIAASDEGADLLTAADGALEAWCGSGKPGEVKTQQGLLMVKSAKDLAAFSTDFASLIAQHRFWERCPS